MQGPEQNKNREFTATSCGEEIRNIANAAGDQLAPNAANLGFGSRIRLNIYHVYIYIYMFYIFVFVYTLKYIFVYLTPFYNHQKNCFIRARLTNPRSFKVLPLAYSRGQKVGI